MESKNMKTGLTVLEAECWKDGELILTGSVRDISEAIGIHKKTAEAHVLTELPTRGGYIIRYTGRKIKWDGHKPGPGREAGHNAPKPKPRKKPVKDLAKVEAMARAAGMHYGPFVGLTGI